MGKLLAHLMVFLGAFLLFGMEPVTGRLLVPYFGGAVHIWLVCLVYFQFLLLLGYLYAHLLARRLAGRHLLVLLLPLVNLPLQIQANFSPTAETTALLATLTRHIALPFTVLSTTVVVTQLWVVQASARLTFNPYHLYATSNAGSLAALLGYPLLVEPFFGLKVQSLAWSGGYVLYLLAAVGVWRHLKPRFPDVSPREAKEGGEEEAAAPVEGKGGGTFWLLLSFLTSALLVTVTNLIAMEIGSFPLVWVLPLALYLASFIITFRDTDRFSLQVMYLWPEVIILAFILFLIPASRWIFHLLLLLVFFVLCVMIHGDLYRRRPHPSRLTGFYLAVALGGFLGGMAVTLGAPLVFREIYEYPLMLVFLTVFFGWRYHRFVLQSWSVRSILVVVSRLGAAGALYTMLFLVSGANFAGEKKESHRNYYGVSRILDYPPDRDAPGGVRILVHGSTIHGLQYRDREREKWPTMYYHPKAGLAEVMELLPGSRRIAVLGLGTATFGMLTAPGDTLTYYEIDPDMEKLARRWFTYLDNTPARVRLVTGDGRLNLQGSRETYDLLFVDAFSGDGIPTHLLTKEALEIYRDRLAPRGLLILHLTNRYYELRGVVKAILEVLGLPAVTKRFIMKSEDTYLPLATVYLVVARDSQELKPLIAKGWTPLGPSDGLPRAKPWTDDYINVLAPAAAKLLAPSGS